MKSARAPAWFRPYPARSASCERDYFVCVYVWVFVFIITFVTVLLRSLSEKRCEMLLCVKLDEKLSLSLEGGAEQPVNRLSPPRETRVDFSIVPMVVVVGGSDGLLPTTGAYT